MLITFSGLDGSGKTTLITHLVGRLKNDGHKVKLVHMYYDLAFCSHIRRARDCVKRTVLGWREEKNKGPDAVAVKAAEAAWDGEAADPKLSVDDKKGIVSKMVYRIFRSRVIKSVFLFLDLLDIIIYRFVCENIRKNVLIADRYLYDSLADVVDVRGNDMPFVNFFLKIIPKTDAPIFIDVLPETAFARKREYPVNYMKWRRGVYHNIFNSIEGAIFINNEAIDSSKKDLENAVMKVMEGR